MTTTKTLLDQQRFLALAQSNSQLFLRILDTVLTPEQVAAIEQELEQAQTDVRLRKLQLLEQEVTKIGVPEVETAYRDALDSYTKKVRPVEEEEDPPVLDPETKG